MKDAILEIVMNNIHYQSDEDISQEWISYDKLAREVAELMTAFIEYFTSEESEYAILYGDQPKRFATDKVDYTIDELFTYWKDNVYKK